MVYFSIKNIPHLSSSFFKGGGNRACPGAVAIGRGLKIFLLAAVVLFLSAGCSISFRSGGRDGGVFLSKNGGQNWEQKVFVREIKPGKQEKIDSIDVRKIIMSRSDSRQLYLATVRDGLFFTPHQGEQWISLFSNQAVQDLTVDAKQPQRLTVALANQIISSDDSGQQWKLQYRDEVAGAVFLNLKQSLINPQVFFAGLSDGRLLMSVDNGIQWNRQHQFDREQIIEIFLSPFSSQRLFVVTSAKIYRSDNGGKDWINLMEKADQENPGILDKINAAAFDPGSKIGEEMILFSSSFGLAFTENGGNDWRVPTLAQPPRRVSVMSVAIDPKNRRRFYYATASGLYRTSDAGGRWQFFLLPTSRAPVSMVIDWYNPQNIYIGAQRIKK